MTSRCATLALLGVRLGRGATFLRPADFLTVDTGCIGIKVAGCDCGLGEWNACSPEEGAGTVGRTGIGEGGVTRSGIDVRRKAGWGAGGGIVVMARVAAERSALGDGVDVRRGLTGSPGGGGNLFLECLLGPSLTLSFPKSSRKSSKSTEGRCTSDVAGLRIHNGTGRVNFPCFTGNGSYSHKGG